MTGQLETLREGLMNIAASFHLLAHLQLLATWNLHTTQPNTLFPTYDEVVNLTGLLETKGMSVSSGK
jgi:hypothetical protein